jgi:hypothetical protein
MAPMNVDNLIEDIRRQLESVAAAGGEEAQALAGQLVEPLGPAIRIAIQEALVAATEEITLDMAPGSVELRLRGHGPEFVVRLPETVQPEATRPAAEWSSSGDSADEASEISRINLRLPDRLKSRVEEAAASEGLSVNAWLVRVVASVVDRGPGPRTPQRRTAQGTERYTGWVR